MARPKDSRDIAPMIRAAFIRAAKHLEADKKPLHQMIKQSLEDNLIGTLRALGPYVPKETAIKGSIDHDHKHEHTHVGVSDTSEWVTTMLGSTEDRTSKKPVSH